MTSPMIKICFLVLLTCAVCAKKRSKKTSPEHLTAQDDDWRFPAKPNWSPSDSPEIKEFYDKYVAIDENEWKINVKHVNYILDYMTRKIKEGSISHPEIDFEPYIRQGSANEGLKVNSCDEFDVVIPFEFPGVEVKVQTTGQSYEIPTGYAEIEFVDIPSDLKKEFSKLIVNKKGKKQQQKHLLLSTKKLHDTKFKSIFDKVLNKIKSEIEVKENGGKQVIYNIKRKSNAPSITLDVTITEVVKSTTSSRRLSIDFIPGYRYHDGKSSRLLVPKWIPESKNVKLKREFENTDTIWKISFYNYESMFVEKSRGQQGADFLVTAFRILKGLKLADKERKRSSQFASVMSTYYMKNILLYGLLFSQQTTETKISSVTEALGCLIGMLNIAIYKQNLPKFSIGNPYLPELLNEELPFSQDDFRMNIFLELSDTALEQSKKDLGDAMQHFKIENKSLMKTALKFKAKFEEYIDGETNHDEL